MDYKNQIERAKAFSDAMNEYVKTVLSGPESYFWERIDDYMDVLFNRLAPFKVGDRVKLTKTPEITKDKSWGWIGSKHFLIEGAKATVVEVDIYKGKFSLGLHFDRESRLHYETGEEIFKDPDKKSIYTFNEEWVEKL